MKRVLFVIAVVCVGVAISADPQPGVASNLVNSIVAGANKAADFVHEKAGYAVDWVRRHSQPCKNDDNRGFCVPQCDDAKIIEGGSCNLKGRVCCDLTLARDSTDDYADPQDNENVGEPTEEQPASTSEDEASSTGPSCNTSAYGTAFGCGDRFQHGRNLGAAQCFKLKPGQNTLKSDVSITTALMCPLLRLIEGAKAAGITRFNINSGFRTNAEQQALRRQNCRGGGKCKPATAPAGYSNHQNGIAVDIEVRSNPALYTWLSNNAAKFGFIRTVPSEMWHWEHRPGAKCNSIVKYTCKNA